MSEKVAYKARKTPSSVHPPAPPRIPINIESYYYTANAEILDSATASYADRIVTSQIIYKPGLLAAARIVFEGTRWKIYHERDVVRVVPFPGISQIVDWDNNLIQKWENTNTRSDSEGIAFYAVDSSFEFSQDFFEQLKDEYIKYLISNETLELQYNPHLKVHRKLEEDESAFQARCLEKLRDMYSQEYQTLLDTLSRQADRLKEKLEREIREHGNPNEGGGGNVDVNAVLTNEQEMQSHGAIVNMEDIRRELVGIQKSREPKLTDFEENLLSLSRQSEMDILRVNHGNVKILRFALVWLPYTEFVIQDGDIRRLEVVQAF